MSVFDKGEDVPGGFVDGGAAAMESGIGDGDRRAPGLAAVFAAAGHDGLVAEGDEHGALDGHDHIGEAIVFEHLLQLHLRLAEEGLERAFEIAVGGPERERAHAGSHEEGGEVSGHFFLRLRSRTGSASCAGSQRRCEAMMAACFGSPARLVHSCGSRPWS